MSSSEMAIHVRSLSKRYEIYDHPSDRLKQSVMPGMRNMLGLQPKQYFSEFCALNDISFKVHHGETVGIIGRNGSGKSTLLQIICGTLNPSSGRVEVNGRIAALLELGSGFNPEFTGRENVYMNALTLGLSKKETAERIDEIIAFSGIGQFIDQQVKTYSSGMVVRLAFAVIAHVDADVLVIDEALSVGDAFFVQKCMRYLRGFMEKGTVLFVSHDTGAVLNLCQRALWLKDGRIAAQGNPKDITARYLENLYEVQSDGIVMRQTRASDEEKDESRQAPAGNEPARDMRLDYLNQTTLRNDIELMPFNSDVEDFGIGGAEITNVQLLDMNGVPLSWVVGGDPVRLEISCLSKADLVNPIVGFQLKDRLGQIIFSDNTFLTYCDRPLRFSAGEHFVGIFEFVMPVMPVGSYSVSPAVAEGTQEDHVQHHWIHDALIFDVHTSSVCLGLVGLPMQNIELRKR